MKKRQAFRLSSKMSKRVKKEAKKEEMADNSNLDVFDMPAQPDPQYAAYARVPKKKKITEQEKHEGW